MRAGKKNITTIADLAVLEDGYLPGGIRCSKSYETNEYAGKKAALIEGGYARSEWFPTEPLPPGRNGGRKCKWLIPGVLGRIKLYRLANGRWSVTVPVDAEEKARRSAQINAKEEREQIAAACEGDADECRRIERLNDIIRTLPAFIPGSMSESEKLHMRIFRAISEDQREEVADRTEWFLTGEKSCGTQEVTATRPKLQLVIDNEDIHEAP